MVSIIRRSPVQFSACNAGAVVTQQGVAARLPPGQAFDPAVLVRLARRPAWLAAVALITGGFVLQAVALGLGGSWWSSRCWPAACCLRWRWRPGVTGVS
jgi:hypothetical protein